MDTDKARKYVIGSGLLAAFVATMVFNNVAVVRAEDDQYCSHDGDTGACMDNASNPCTQFEGWSCRPLKILQGGCGCSYGS